MTKNKRYAVLLVFLSVVGMAALHTPTRAGPPEFVLLFQGSDEETGVLLVESIRPIQLGIVAVNGTPTPAQDAVLRCSLEETSRDILLVDALGAVQSPATLASILLQCRTGLFRVTRFRFK